MSVVFTVLSWVVAALFLIFALVVKTAAAKVMLLLAALLILPIRPIRNIISKAKIKTWMCWVLAPILFISAALTDSNAPAAETAEVSRAVVSETAASASTPTPIAEISPTMAPENTPAPTDTPAPTETPEATPEAPAYTVDIDAINSSLVDALPDNDMRGDYFLAYADEYSSGNVQTDFQIDIESDSETRIREVLVDCYDISRSAVDGQGANLEAVYITLLNNGAPVGIFMTQDGNAWTKTMGGVQESFSLQDLEPATEQEILVLDNDEIGQDIERATPDQPEESSAPADIPAHDYVINTNTGKFHFSGCSSVDKMAEEHKWYYTGTAEEITAMGYVPCKRCNPH